MSSTSLSVSTMKLGVGDALFLRARHERTGDRIRPSFPHLSRGRLDQRACAPIPRETVDAAIVDHGGARWMLGPVQRIAGLHILQGNRTDRGVGESGRQVTTANVDLSGAGVLRGADTTRQIGAGQTTLATRAPAAAAAYMIW
jgi:hypothetical protein